MQYVVMPMQLLASTLMHLNFTYIDIIARLLCQVTHPHRPNLDIRPSCHITSLLFVVPLLCCYSSLPSGIIKLLFSYHSV